MVCRGNSGRRPLRRAVGVSAVGAFLTFGMTPVAQADDFGLDTLINSVIESLSGAVPAADAGGPDVGSALAAAAFPPPQPADNFFLDLVNMPSVLLFGRELASAVTAVRVGRLAPRPVPARRLPPATVGTVASAAPAAAVSSERPAAPASLAPPAMAAPAVPADSTGADTFRATPVQ